MPRIPQYNAPAADTELRPTETGIDALQQAARRTGAFYNEAGQDVTQIGQRSASALRDAMEVGLKAAEHHDINVGSANFAALQDNLTQQWNQIAKTADPNDATVAQKFRAEVMQPALDKFQEEGFITEAGQKFAQAHVSALREHLLQKTDADMGTLAGQAAKVNTAQTINRLSNTAYNDGSSLDFALKTLDTSIEGVVGSSPNLKGAQAGAIKSEIIEKGREQIVKSAAIGEIERTAKVPDWVTDPKYSKYVNGIELRQFQKAADAQAKANAYYDRQTEVLKKQQADLQVHKDASDLIAKGVQVDPNDPNRLLIAPDFLKNAIDIARKNPDAPSAASTVRTMIDWAESQHRQRTEPVVSDQTVKADLLARIGAPDNPTNEMQVLDWATRDKLSSRDATLLREMVKTVGPEAMRDPLVHTALQGASERAGVGLMIDGHERYSNFLQAFWPEYLRQKNAGTLKPNWADFNDETSLIRQTLKTYEPSKDQRVHAALMKNLQAIDADVNQKPAPALPALDERKAGQTYQTARGPMKWTGTGWVAP